MIMKYDFCIEKAKEIISKVNKDPVFITSDFLVFTQAKILQNSFNENNTIPLILLINGLWATQLFREEGSIQKIISNINNNVNNIHSALVDLNTNDLKEDPKRVYEAVKNLFPIILESGKRKNYSFTSKFFHWCTCKHFPIMDKRARKSINRFQRKHGVRKGRVLSDTSAMGKLTYVQEYERWINFYSNLLHSMSEEDCNSLREVDFETQRQTSPCFLCEHSILRILDKVFYGCSDI